MKPGTDRTGEEVMYRNRIKRVIAIIMSLCGIICLSWLYIILIIAIKIDSPGPVFFKQKRVGIHKKHFQILKFRTMRIDTPHDMPTHMLENPDQYITKVGSRLSTKEQKNLQRNGNTAFCGVFFLPIFRFCPYYGYQHV